MPPVVADGLEHGLVVLVDEYHDALSGLLTGAADDAVEAHGRAYLRRAATVELFPSVERIVEHVLQTFRAVVFLRVEVEVQYGVGRPVFGQRVDCQALEQLPFSFEIRLYGAD